jgi:hypothetical protein
MITAELDLEYGKFRSKMGEAVKVSRDARRQMAAETADLGGFVFGGGGSGMGYGAGRSGGRIGGRPGGGGGFMGQASMQAQDAIVQAQMGTNPALIVGQQAPQLLGALGPKGALIGAIIAAGAALATLGQTAKKEFEGIQSEGEDLEKTLQRLADTGTLPELIGGAEQLDQRMTKLNTTVAASNTVWGRFKGFLADVMGGVSNDEKAAELSRQQAESLKMRYELQKAALDTSAEELEIAKAKASGDETAAKQLARRRDLANEIAKIEASSLSRQTKNQMIRDAESASAFTGAAEDRADADRKAKEQSDARDRVQSLRDQTDKQARDVLPDDQKLGALKKEMEGVFAKMQSEGGLFFDPSIAGLQKLVDARIQSGDNAGAEAALEMLREAQALMAEMDALTAKIRDQGAAAAKEMADKAKEAADAVADLRKDTGGNALNMLPPKEQMDAFRNELKSAFGFDVNSSADVSRGLKGLQAQADAARAAGDTDAEKTALEKLKAAQESAQNLAGVDLPTANNPIGSLGGAVNRILGRDANEIVAEETRRQTDVLIQIERLLRGNQGNNRPQALLPPAPPDTFR